MIYSQMKDCAACVVLNLRIRAGVEQQINDRPFASFDCQVEGCLAFKGFPCVNFLTSRFTSSVQLDPDVEPAALPSGYLRVKTTYSPDKTALAIDLKAGVEIPGAALVHRRSWSIK